MLPTKGYFQDIECPYYNSSCGRPYCHFRHKKKLTDNVEESVTEPEKEDTNVIPTYKPTPKSELANIHTKSHIPISYVPDLTFRPERKVRPVPKFEKPTYKPTPLSILSSANQRLQSVGDENGENIEAIKEIKQNIANMAYDPATSLQPAEDIDFEELDSEFAIIDEIIRSTDFKKKKKQFSVDSLASEEPLEDCSKLEELSNAASEFSSKQKSLLSEHETEVIKSKEKTNVRTETDIERKKERKIDKDKHELEKSYKKDSSKDNIKDSKTEKFNDKNKEQSSEKKKDNFSDKSKKNSNIKKDKIKVHVVQDKKKEDYKKSESKIKENDKSKGSDKLKTSKHDKSDREKNEKNNEKPHKSSSKDKHRKEEVKDRKDKYEKKDKEKSRSRTKSRSRSIERVKYKDANEDKQKRTDKSTDKPSKEKSTSQHKSQDSSKERKSSKNENERHKSRQKTEEKETIKKRSQERRNSKERSEDRRKSKEHNEDRKNKEHTENKYKTKNKYKVISDASKSKTKHDHTLKTDKSSSKNEISSSKEKTKIKDSSCSEDNVSDSDRDILMDGAIDNDNLMDVDLDEDVDQTLLECYKIFNEYTPTPKPAEPVSESEMFSPEHSSIDSTDLISNEYSGRKRIAHTTIDRTHSQLHPPEKPKSVPTPGQTLTNRYKLAKLAQANREQELLMNEIQQPSAIKRPAPSLLEAARARKIRKEQEASNHININIIDDILKGSSNKTVPPATPIPRPKIAPAQNVSLMAKAKERISKLAKAPPKTVAQTQKGPRVAHVPDTSLSDIPDVLEADKSRLPVNVRTRFLTLLADECVKLYISKEEAFARALHEEYACYAKSKVLTIYRNSAMLAVNRMRKEIQDRNSNGLGLIGVGEDEDRGPGAEFRGRGFYNKIKKWILTEEELDIHGYPRESEEYHGKAKIQNPRFQFPANLDENQRLCSRCKKVYSVDDDGWPLYEEECLYHPLKKRTIRGEQTYLCCRSNDESGCATSDTHVSEGFSSAELEGYQTTLEPESDDDPRNFAVYALDCEMCYTTKGLELTRVTIVDADCKTVYESLVKPLNPIIDYNTRFSGITKEQMDRTSTSILQVQANILHLCNANTILVGHSLESDMKALKIVHGTVIDTSVLFPHKMGLPHKRALRALASEYLRKIIQNDVSGHDSAEDAVTCMELLKWKLKEESKSRSSK